MFKVKTKNLQEMVGKLSKCGGNKLLEITRYYNLEVGENGLVLTATDGSNFITVTDLTVKAEPFTAIVKADQFSKLVQRTSVDEMKFTLKENYLDVVGNGKYKVEIVEGEVYPTYDFTGIENPMEVQTSVLKYVAGTNKYSVSTTIADGVLTGYLFSDGKCITADGIKVCITPATITEGDCLLTQETITLIGALTDEKTKISVQDGKVLFETSNTTIFSTEMEGIEEYPDIAPLSEIEFPSMCSLSKLAILNILDRLTLFIDPFEKNEIKLHFTDKGLEISTNSGSYELIAYSTSKDFQEFICSVNGLFFKELVSAVNTENFTIQYGEEALIRIESDNLVQLLATGEGEE